MLKYGSEAGHKWKNSKNRIQSLQQGVRAQEDKNKLEKSRILIWEHKLTVKPGNKTRIEDRIQSLDLILKKCKKYNRVHTFGKSRWHTNVGIGRRQDQYGNTKSMCQNQTSRQRLSCCELHCTLKEMESTVQIRGGFGLWPPNYHLDYNNRGIETFIYPFHL